MIRIAFIHPHKSFLQNIEAYDNFFARYGVTTSLHNPGESEKISAECVWHFMGTDTRRRKNCLTIHEYTSASVPPFSRLKDRIKKLINVVPDYRIFNSRFVQESFDFRDRVPSGIRDYGVTEICSEATDATPKDFDFIYLGSLGKERRLDALFRFFTAGPLRNRTLLVLSQGYEALASRLSPFPNIQFAGPVAHREVYSYISRCRYGINFIPDRIPFNRQASAKLLDYAASRIPVITTDYAWVRSFQEKTGGNFYMLTPGLANFSWEAILRFPFRIPDLSGWSFEEQLQQSGVLAFLTRQFPGLSFAGQNR